MTHRLNKAVQIVILLLCTAPAIAQIDQLPHADTTAGNFFGVAVALDSTRALVGASGEHSCLVDGGAAYLFEQDLQTRRWHKVARLVAKDCEERRFFGRSVALDGTRALVSASSKEGMHRDPDVVYVFERDSTGHWVQTASLTTGNTHPDGNTGTQVALAGDVAVLTTWGDTSTGNHGGAAYVFHYDPNNQQWHNTARLTGSGGIRHGIFGGDFSLDGSTLAIPSSQYLQEGTGSLYLFEQKTEETWNELTRIDDVDDFFISTDLDGVNLLIGESRAGRGQSGRATLYTQDSTGVWQLAAQLKPPTPYRYGAFGSLVALDGGRALIVGYDEQLRLDFNIDRVVYVYAQNRDTNTWEYQGIIDIGHVAFGAAMDLDGRVALIGASSQSTPGSAYIVRIP